MDPHTYGDGLIQKTCSDFAALLQISSESNVQAIDESIEGVLSRLDELYGMLDMIRNDNAVLTDELLSTVREKMKELQPVFAKIDKMEQFVQMVKGNVLVIEEEVKAVESDFSAISSIKKAITGFSFLPGKKKTITKTTATTDTPYVAPNIFSTSEWLHPRKSPELATEVTTDS